MNGLLKNCKFNTNSYFADNSDHESPWRVNLNINSCFKIIPNYFLNYCSLRFGKYSCSQISRNFGINSPKSNQLCCHTVPIFSIKLPSLHSIKDPIFFQIVKRDIFEMWRVFFRNLLGKTF